MMPLPDLSPLDPSPPVFDSTADDWVTQFADLQGQHDSLTAALGSSGGDLNTGAGGITGTIDAISNGLDAAEALFAQLAAEQQALDLSSTVLDVLASDNALAAGLDSFAPDIGTLAGGFLSGLQDLFTTLLQPILDAIAYLAQLIVSIFEQVVAAIEQMMFNLHFIAPTFTLG